MKEVIVNLRLYNGTLSMVNQLKSESYDIGNEIIYKKKY